MVDRCRVILSLKYISHNRILWMISKRTSREKSKKINTSVLESTFFNFRKRCHLLIENGGHIDKKKILTTQFPFNLFLKWCIGLKDPI